MTIFHNNDNESVNKVRKSTLNSKSSRELGNNCDTPKNNFYRAIFDEGLYRVRTEYTHCKIKRVRNDK